MLLAEEALGVDFVNFLGARRARRKPTILRDHLNSTDGICVPRRGGQNLLDLLTRHFGNVDIGWG